MLKALYVPKPEDDLPAKKQQVERPLDTTIADVNRLEGVMILCITTMTTKNIAFILRMMSCCRYFLASRIGALMRIFSISSEQANCLLHAYLGENLFITGPAGTGKSFISRMISDMLYGVKKAVKRTASTGIAAVAIGGITIHSFLGIGVAQRLDPKTIAGWVNKKNYVWDNLVGLDTLFLDEISMFNAAQMELLEMVTRIMKGDHSRIAGGLQIIISGDFLQLPPVQGKFAFHSPVWWKFNFVNCYLKTSYRQADRSWFDMLCKIRLGVVDQPTLKSLLGRLNRIKDPDCCRLYSKKEVVQKANDDKLDQLPGDMRVYFSRTSIFQLEKKRLRGRELVGCLVGEAASNLDKHYKVGHCAKFKVGARVMLVENLKNHNLCNGSIGTIVEMRTGSIKVKFPDIDNAIVSIEKCEWEVIDTAKQQIYVRVQVPLILAYAITIHKAQGMGLKQARTSLRRVEIFAGGQAYVSLSRLQSLEGLSLDGFDMSAIRAHPECLEFYKSIDQ